uniref:Uncharacterized protein n=1 Tax=Amphimedon queenslandica TaxID=400682 RepID=A0A1X7U5J6_AMPQE
LTSLRKGCRKTLDFDTSAEASPEILLGTLCFQPNKKITVSALSELLHQERVIRLSTRHSIEGT